MRSFVPTHSGFIGVVVDSAVTYVKRKLNLLAYVERVDDTTTESQYAVVDFVPTFVGLFRSTGIVVNFSKSPIATGTNICSEVVFATRFITTSPICQVKHYVNNRTYMVEYLFVVTIYFVVFPIDTGIGCSVLWVSQTFSLQPVYTKTSADNRRKPFSYV